MPKEANVRNVMDLMEAVIVLLLDGVTWTLLTPWTSAAEGTPSHQRPHEGRTRSEQVSERSGVGVDKLECGIQGPGRVEGVHRYQAAKETWAHSHRVMLKDVMSTKRC